jgi:hypothetical protein
MKVADKQRIKNLLFKAEGQWVCSQIFFRELFIKDYAQRISELRSMGLDIEGKVCDQHGHKLFMYKYNRVIKQETLL